MNYNSTDLIESENSKMTGLSSFQLLELLELELLESWCDLFITQPQPVYLCLQKYLGKVMFLIVHFGCGHSEQ